MNNIELRSEEVREIIGKVPNKIIRFGIVSIFIILLLIFGVSFYIKIPQYKEVDSKIIEINKELYLKTDLKHLSNRALLGRKIFVSYNINNDLMVIKIDSINNNIGFSKIITNKNIITINKVEIEMGKVSVISYFLGDLD